METNSQQSTRQLRDPGWWPHLIRRGSAQGDRHPLPSVPQNRGRPNIRVNPIHVLKRVSNNLVTSNSSRPKRGGRADECHQGRGRRGNALLLQGENDKEFLEGAMPRGLRQPLQAARTHTGKKRKTASRQAPPARAQWVARGGGPGSHGHGLDARGSAKVFWRGP